MAEGLTTFLGGKGNAWCDKGCAVTIIMPMVEEAGWGAIRLEVQVYSLSGLIALRKIMKKEVEAANVTGQQVRTRKHRASS